MTKLNENEVRAYLNRRYPEEHIADISFNDSETMAFALLWSNTSCVNRVVVDINSDGDMDVWMHEVAEFREIYRRRDI